MLGQGDPDEHAAFGFGPLDARRHLACQGREHVVAAGGIDPAQHLGMFGQMQARDLFRHHLVRSRGVQIRRLFHQDQFADHLFRRTNPAHPQAGRQRFRERAAIDRPAVLDAALAGDFKGQDRRDRLAIKAQGLIGGILDHGDVHGIGQVDHRLARRAVQRLAGGVGKIDRQIGIFHPSALGLGPRSEIGGREVRARVEPVIIRLIGVEGAERAKIGRPANQNRVVRADHQLAKVVQRLLAAAGDQDIAGIAGNAQLGHFRRDPVAQGLVALGHRILQRPRRAVIRQGIGIGGAIGLGREQRRVRDAAGKGDDVGLVEQLQKLPDLRGLHPRRPAGQNMRPIHHRSSLDWADNSRAGRVSQYL